MTGCEILGLNRKKIMKKSWRWFLVGTLLAAGSLAVSIASASAAPQAPANKADQDKTKIEISSSTNQL
jgi:hypothetical protein